LIVALTTMLRTTVVHYDQANHPESTSSQSHSSVTVRLSAQCSALFAGLEPTLSCRHGQWFLCPKIWNRNQAHFPPPTSGLKFTSLSIFELNFPNPSPFLAASPLQGESYVNSVDCKVKNNEKVLIYTLNKTPPPIFHRAQAVPTSYRDRSQWTYEQKARPVLYATVIYPVVRLEPDYTAW